MRRRTTLHDVGAPPTRERIIRWKRYAEGEPADPVAWQLHHSLEAVERYPGAFGRVRRCRREGPTAEKAAYTLKRGVWLVDENPAIDQELKGRS